MKQIIYLFIGLIVAGCTRQQPASVTIATSAKETIAAMYQSLPDECKTESNQKQLWAAQSAIDAVVQSCETEKSKINQEKIKWQWAFWGLLAVMAAYVLKRVVR